MPESAVTETPVSASSEGGGLPNRGSRTGRAMRTLAPVLPLITLFVVLSIASSHFLSKTNLLNILQANAEIGIAACAGTLVIIAGGVDLSVGAIYAVAGVLSARVAISSGVGAGVAAGIAAGVALGLVNGLDVAVAGVNPLIATIAGGIVISGAAQVLAGQSLLTPTSAHFGTLGTGHFLGIYYSSWIFILVALAFGWVSSAGRFGREARVTGANSEAARLSGVRINRIRCLTYVLSGAAAAVAESRGGLTERAGPTTIGGTPLSSL